MNAPLVALLFSEPIPGGVKKKRVLLIDASHGKRDLRAEILRKFGIEVDVAVDIVEARAWWKPALYNLVLINLEKGRGQRDKFCDELRSATPPQRLAFLVGRPEYLADSPSAAQESATKNADKQAAICGKKAIFSTDSGDRAQRWSILAASRRISVVRSASIARTQAMRELPPPPRDCGGRPEKSTPRPANLDDLLKEELR